MEAMTLVQIKQIFMISRRAIQGYERYGLVKSTGKTKRGYLTYDEKAVQRIREIKLYQDIGFMVKEIGAVIDASDEVIRDALLEKRSRLRTKRTEINQLIELIDQRIAKM